MDLMKLGRVFWRDSREGAGASLMTSWMKSFVCSSFQTELMVSLTTLFSRVAKPLIAKRKSGQAGSRGATRKVKLMDAQTRRSSRIWRWVSDML